MIWRILFFIYPIILIGQNRTIEGRVMTDDGQPAIFAIVSIYEDQILKVGSETDIDGYFTLNHIDLDSGSIVISYTGYTSIKQHFAFDDKNSLTLNFQLNSRQMLEEIVVIDYKVPSISMDATASSQIVTSEKIRNLPVKDINNITAQSAGASAKNNGNINIRGARANSSNYYIVGIRVNGKLQQPSNLESGQIPNEEQELEVPPAAYTLTGSEWDPFQRLDEWKDMQETSEMQVVLDHYPDFVHPYIAELHLKHGDGFDAVGKTCEVWKDEKLIGQFVTDNRDMLRIPVANRKCKLKVKVNGQQKSLGSTKKKYELHLDEFCTAPSGVIDISFVVDATGSQTDEIQFLKQELFEIIDKLEEDEKLYRFSATFFTDHGESALPTMDFTTDYPALQNFINEQHASGGDECINLGLETAIEQSNWHPNAQAKLLFLMLDFGYQEQTPPPQRYAQLIQKAQAEGIRIIPITGSGIGRQMEYFMKWTALQTNGTYVGLTDDSGVGGRHLEQEANDLEVELLGDIMTRLISDMTETDHCEVMENKETECDAFTLQPTITSSTTSLKSGTAGYVDIVSTEGITVMTSPITEGLNELQVFDLNEGTYYVKLMADQTACVQTLIVQR